MKRLTAETSKLPVPPFLVKQRGIFAASSSSFCSCLPGRAQLIVQKMVYKASFNFGQAALEFDKHVIMRTAVSQQPIVFRIYELKVLERD